MDRLDVETAEHQLEEARVILRDPVATRYPDHTFQTQELERNELRLVEVKAEVERRRIAEAVQAQESKLEELQEKLEMAVDPLRGKDTRSITREGVDEATQYTREVKAHLAEGLPLEAEAPKYKRRAASAQKRLKQVRKVLDRASKVVEFVDGPVAASEKARELEERAEASTDLAEALSLLVDAKAQLDRCIRLAGDLLKKAPKLGALSFRDGDRERRPKALKRSCQKRVKQLKRTLKRTRKKLKKAKKKS